MGKKFGELNDEEFTKALKKTVERSEAFTHKVSAIRREMRITPLEMAFFTRINMDASLEEFPKEMKAVDDFFKLKGL
jgi:hypothetical protein